MAYVAVKEFNSVFSIETLHIMVEMAIVQGPFDGDSVDFPTNDLKQLER